MKEQDIVIIGGGLAGLTAAIHLALEGQQVLLFESHTYPHHKVCGEYLSNEVNPYLERLGVFLKNQQAVSISKLQISGHSGQVLETDLPMGGMGISRYHLDHILYQRACELGVCFCFERVMEVRFLNEFFHIKSHTKNIKAKMALGAYGKRDALDKKLQRSFSYKKETWLAVKGHYNHPNFPENLVALHNFEGGYGGISKTEFGTINFCYLVHYKSFKKHKNIEAFQKKVLYKNPHLARFLEEASPVFATPLTIAQIYFDKKSSVENHMLMCGDTAGLIHPLCGNGMAMAIHSAKMASELILKYMAQPSFTRASLEQAYAQQWKKTFSRRLWFGRQLQGVLMQTNAVTLGVITMGIFRNSLKYIIHKTHGEFIT